MSKRKPLLLLGDILESAQKILLYTAHLSFDEFLSNDMATDAVVRNFEIIGEASARLPNEFRHSHPEIDWVNIIGLRNRIVHEYFGINYDSLWSIKENLLPDLIINIQKILENL